MKAYSNDLGHLLIYMIVNPQKAFSRILPQKFQKIRHRFVVGVAYTGYK